MRKNIRVSEPSAEMQMKIQMARHAIQICKQIETLYKGNPTK